MGDQAHIDAFLAPRPPISTGEEGHGHGHGHGRGAGLSRDEIDHAALERAENEAARIRSSWRDVFDAYERHAKMEAENRLKAVLRRRDRIMRLAQKSDAGSQMIMLSIYERQIADIKERLGALLDVKRREIRERYARRALRVMLAAERLHSKSITLEDSASGKSDNDDDDDSYHPGDSRDMQSDDSLEGEPSSSGSERHRGSGYSDSDSHSDSDSDGDPVSAGHSYARGTPRRCLERRQLR